VTTKAPDKGDSGSPLVTERDGGRLLGMHIAGDPKPGVAYAIPAWRLVSPGEYAGGVASDFWRVLDPMDPTRPAGSAAPEVPAAPAPAAAAPGAPKQRFAWESALPDLRVWHAYADGVRWRCTPDGVEIEGTGVERTPGAPDTMTAVWSRFGEPIRAAATRYGVPIELVLATIATESSGRPDAIRREPGYTSDEATPGKVSVGLMQTLISTAREALDDPATDRSALLAPATSILAGTACIASRRRTTLFDPPKVACAYNAGGVYENRGSGNRWKMKQYPIGTAQHADRFVRWFNDAVSVLRPLGVTPSFAAALA